MAAFYHLRDAFFCSAFQRWRERSSRDESLPVSVSRRCWLTFEPFRIPGLATLYTAPSRSFAVRLVHREGLTDSHGSHPLRAPPSLTLCPYYSRSGSACQGVFEDFFRGSSNLVLGSSPKVKSVTTWRPLARLPSASLGGVGVRSPPDNDIISYPHKETMDKAGKFLTRCDRRGRRLAPAGSPLHEPPTEKHNGKAGHTTPKRGIYCKNSRKKEQTEHYESESHYHFLHLSHLIVIIS